MARWVRDPGTEELVQYFDQPEVQRGGWERICARPDELKVLMAELQKCRKDFTFFARNYAWIKTKKRELVPFKLWESQDLLLEKVQEIRAKGKPQKVVILKARQLGFCVDPRTFILTADLRWVQLDDLEPGDELVATDEHAPGGRGNARKLRKATVVAKREVVEPAYRLTMSDGRILIATAEHRFLCRRRSAAKAAWVRVNVGCGIRVGDAIRSIAKPSGGFAYGSQWEGQTLPGMRAGEGYVEVVSIERLATQRLIDLQTTAGTFIANGFVSHNSTLIEVMMAWRVMFYENVMALIVSHAPYHAVELFDKLCLVYDSVPWWMRPMCSSRKIEEGLKFDNPNHDTRSMVPGLKSGVVVQAANQLSGIGQGFTIQAAHLCVSTYAQLRVLSCGIQQVTKVVPGDLVLCSDGSVAPVKKVWKSHRGPETATAIQVWLNYDPLVCTVDHPVLTPSGYVSAGAVEKGDWVRYPVRPISETRKRFAITDRGARGFRYEKTKRYYPLNRDWGFFLGSFLANGSIVHKRDTKGERFPSGVTFYFHTKKSSKMLGAIERCLPGKHLYRYQESENSAMARIHDAGLGRYLEENFGHKEAKHVPEWVWEAGVEFCQGFVDGYVSGDGCFKPPMHQMVARCIRPGIVYPMRDLIASLGYGWCGMGNEKAGVVGGRNCQEQWILTASGDTCRALAGLTGAVLKVRAGKAGPVRWRYSADRKFVEIQVKEVTERREEEFYDVEVDSPTHDFTTTQCCIKNSETADWDDNAAKQILEGDLAYALAENVETFAFVETTAKGSGRFFHKFWEKAVELGDRSEWHPFFVPWFFERDRKVVDLGANFRLEEQELQIQAKVLHQWLRCNNSECGKFRETMQRGIDATESECPACNAGLLKPYLLSDQQLAWMMYKRLNAQKDLDSLKEYHQELPTTPSEAFVISGVQVFPYDAMEWVRHTTELYHPIARGFMDQAGTLHGVASDTGRCPAEGCDVDHRYDDLPITIWNYPEPGANYTIGADVSEGLGGEGDYSVAFINKVSHHSEPDEQVGLFRSNTVDPVSFAFPIAHLGRWYNEAMVSIEVNKYDTTFTWVRNQLQYPNLYRWKHVDSTNTNSNKWGWETNLKSRPRLYQTATKFLRSKMWIIKSQNCYREMQHFQKDDYEDRRVEHSLGEYDDELIAAMISLYCSHDLDYDDNLGYIPIRRNSKDIKTSVWQMRCMHCKHFWGANDPSTQSYCPQCFSLHVQGEKNVLVDLGNQKLWEEMTAEPEQQYAGEPDYECM